MKIEQIAFPLMIAGSVASIYILFRDFGKSAPVSVPQATNTQYFNFAGGTASLPKDRPYIPPVAYQPPAALRLPDVVNFNGLAIPNVTGNLQFTNPRI